MTARDGWGPADALELIEEAGGLAMARIALAAGGLGGAMAAIDALCNLLARSTWIDAATVDTVRRDLNIAAGREYVRRANVLHDVAIAHGMTTPGGEL